MNKEEIEDIKDNLRILHQVLWNEYREGTYTIQRILEYINCLEQKESILDKVTDLATKIATKIATENAEKYNSKSQKEVDFSEWNLALEILNIIEGENHE